MERKLHIFIEPCLWQACFFFKDPLPKNQSCFKRHILCWHGVGHRSFGSERPKIPLKLTCKAIPCTIFLTPTPQVFFTGYFGYFWSKVFFWQRICLRINPLGTPSKKLMGIVGNFSQHGGGDLPNSKNVCYLNHSPKKTLKHLKITQKFPT